MKEILKVIISFLLIIVLPLAARGETGELSVTVTIEQVIAGVVSAPAAESGDPGDILTYAFTVRNTGNGPDTFNLKAKSQKRWPVNLPEGNTTALLATGENQAVNVEVSIPSDETTDTVDILTLVATSQTDRKVTGEDSVNTTLNQVAGIAVSIIRDTQWVIPGDTIIYRFTLRNTGNGPDSFTLEAASSSTWPVTIIGSSYIGPLEPGKKGAAQVDVQLSIPFTATDGEIDILTFTATSDFNPTISSSAQATTTVRIRGRR